MLRESRHCQNCKSTFAIEPEDFAFYENIKVPPPTWCPECRMIRRMVFRNQRFLFRAKDAVSGKEIFSGIPPQTPLKVYEKEYWRSDAWDPMEYGRDYDFSRSFFEQFRELLYTVPWPSRYVANMVNADYANNAESVKNCYLCFNLGFCEDSAYLVDAVYLKNCFDVSSTTSAELCYDGMAVRDCFKTFYSLICEKCSEVWLSRDCIGCSHCFGCANLRNKQYYIYNRPYSREGYFAELERLLQDGSWRALVAAHERAQEVWQRHPYKYLAGWHNINVTGDWMAYCKNAKYCFNGTDLEDSAWCQDAVDGVRDSYDVSGSGGQVEILYEAVDIWQQCRNVKFSFSSWPAASDVEYSANCPSSSDVFGCASLHKKSYCILNKQYSPDDYRALREKIIRHMDAMPYTDQRGRVYRYGEFFPPEFSPFAYNETIAQDFFPLTKEAAQAKGFLWRDPEQREYQTTIDAKNLPDRIGDVQDIILKEIIKCMSCGRAYRVIQMELEFLRQMRLPLPRICPNCRHMERLKLRNQPRFYRRPCQCAGPGSENGVYQNSASHFHGSSPCPNEFETSYAPDKPEIVYCESCYNTEAV